MFSCLETMRESIVNGIFTDIYPNLKSNLFVFWTDFFFYHQLLLIYHLVEVFELIRVCQDEFYLLSTLALSHKRRVVFLEKFVYLFNIIEGLFLVSKVSHQPFKVCIFKRTYAFRGAL